MGGNIVRRLAKAGHECVVFDANPATVKGLVGDKVQGGNDLADLVKKLKKPRAVWVMLPQGEITEKTVNQLGGLLEAGDTIIDGGNAFFHDDVRRAKAMKAKGINYIDCGTSGGVWGLDRGYCLMIGGPTDAVMRLDPIFAALAPGKGSIPLTQGRDKRDTRVEQGYMHAGPCGAGHFVKMVHNGIEYGLMQAYAEGFDILRNADASGVSPEHRFSFDIADIAEVWRRGSVVTSWLLDLTSSALAHEGELDSYSGYIEDSGEGRWTIMAAIDEAVPAEVLSAALYTRFRSRQGHTFAEKIISAMRKGFGGHVEPSTAKKG
jgi:6-phosphogluconate dehydrogenase